MEENWYTSWDYKTRNLKFKTITKITKKVTSAHNAKSYASVVLMEENMRIVNDLLLYAEEHKDDVSRSVLWHFGKLFQRIVEYFFTIIAG